jgi:superoxide dismutase
VEVADSIVGSGWVWLVLTGLPPAIALAAATTAPGARVSVSVSASASASAALQPASTADPKPPAPVHPRLEWIAIPGNGTPIEEGLGVPLLALDLFEHARMAGGLTEAADDHADYVKALLACCDWREVAQTVASALDALA